MSDKFSPPATMAEAEQRYLKLVTDAKDIQARLSERRPAPRQFLPDKEWRAYNEWKRVQKSNLAVIEREMQFVKFAMKQRRRALDMADADGGDNQPEYDANNAVSLLAASYRVLHSILMDLDAKDVSVYEQKLRNDMGEFLRHVG